MKYVLSLMALLFVAGAYGQGYESGVCEDDGDVDTLETICTVEVANQSAITFCGTVATSAFTDFNVDLSNDGENYITFYTASGDYTAPAGHIYSVSADPTTWTTTQICIRLDGLEAYALIRLQAAGTSSNPTISWSLQ